MRPCSTTLNIALIAFLVITANASAQVLLCDAQIDVCVGPGTTTRQCYSADAAVGVITGANCNAPLGNRIAREVCRGTGVLANRACCGCVLPGALACDATLVTSTTVQVVIQSDLGLQSVDPVIAENVQVSGLPITVGTTSPVQVLATKVDPSMPARIELRACDTAQCRLCDPVLTLVVRDTGKAVHEIVADLPEAESKVTVRNGNPGLRHLLIEVNGEPFRVNGLRDGEEVTIDTTSAMLPGASNVISLTATGKPGGQAAVMIHD